MFSDAGFYISYYKPIEWIESGEKCCASKIIQPKCEIKPKQICLELEEVTCEVCRNQTRPEVQNLSDINQLITIDRI